MLAHLFHPHSGVFPARELYLTTIVILAATVLLCIVDLLTVAGR